MAKKMLINADMLLATPRRNEPTMPIAPRVENENSQETPSVSSTPVQVEVAKAQPKVIEDKRMMAITSVQRGLKAGETRATFIVKEEALEKIKAIAYWDRQNIKDIVQVAIEAYIKQYENTKGSVQPIP